jgi:hypothetical protein
MLFYKGLLPSSNRNRSWAGNRIEPAMSDMCASVVKGMKFSVIAIEMTLPGRPDSRLQKHRVTDPGRRWLQRCDAEKNGSINKHDLTPSFFTYQDT